MKKILPFLYCTLAMVACVPQQAQQQPMTLKDVLFQGVFFFLTALAVYWLLVLYPQRMKLEQKTKLLESLKKGDDVVTSGGILGKVQAVSEESVTIEISVGVKVRVKPDHVHLVVKAKGEEAKSSESGKSKK